MSSNITPLTRSLLALRERQWNPAQAIAELIDNSFGEDRGGANEVHLRWYKKSKTLTITDDGRGMDNVERLFRLGDTIGNKASSSDIGFYGSGGTMALLWLADNVSVYTLRNYGFAQATANWPEIIGSDGDLSEVELGDTCWHDLDRTSQIPQQLAALRHGTMIRMKIRKKRRISEANIRQYIALIFSAGLARGLKITWQGDGDSVENLQPWTPPELSDVIEDDFFVQIGEDALLPVAVKAGWSESITRQQSTMHMSFGHRLIARTREPFGDYGGSDVVGWIDLGVEWREYLTSTKESITDDVLLGKLMSETGKIIAPLLKEVKKIRKAVLLEDIKWEIELMLSALDRRSTPAPGGGGGYPETTDRGGTRPQPETTRDVEERGGDSRGKKPVSKIDIRLEPDWKLGGRACVVQLNPGNQIMVSLNGELDYVNDALEKKPINSRLLCSLIASHIGVELIRSKLLDSTGVFSKDELEILRLENKEDELALIPHVFARLMGKLSVSDEAN